MPDMKRRTFIRAAIVLLATMSIALLTLNFRATCRAMILEDIGKLRIRREAVDRFMEEAEEECLWERFSYVKRLFIILQHGFQLFNLRLPFYSRYVNVRNQITGLFLLSTDMFFNPASTGEIKYIAYHNPYKLACSNPFSNLWSASSKLVKGTRSTR